MVSVQRLFAELYYEVFKISFLQAFIDSIIFFMVALNITTLLDISFYFALFTTIAFLAIDLTYRMKKTTLNQIEEKNPNVRDILRTAKDNLNGTNFMVLAMFEELIERMKTVSAGTLLNNKELFLKVATVCILSFSVIFLSANAIHVPKSLFDPDTYYQFFSKPGQDHMDFYSVEFNESDELIYGDASLTQLGNKTLDIRVNPSMNEVGFQEIKPPEEKEFERGTFPSEVAAVTDISSEEKLPKESKLAIAYNMKLKEIS